MLLNRGPNAFGHRLGSGNGAPAWLPEGAVAGVDYPEGEAYLFDTLITDLSTIHGNGLSGAFDPAAITAAGMAVTDANANRPEATNELVDVFAAMDFCVMIEWDQLDLPGGFGGTIIYADDNDADNLFTQVGGTGDAIWTDGNNGEFNTVGVVADNARNKIAASANAAGWLVSVNGQTAVQDSPVNPALDTPTIRACIGCYFGETRPINGTIRRIIFYSNEQNAAFVETLSTL